MGKIIVFGFLGSLPQGNNLRHWNKFFKDYDEESIKILFYPYQIDLVDDLENNLKNINIISEDNHINLKDKNSINKAILLMMQESLKLYENNLKKFILLHPSSCPIYNLDFVYKEIVNDNKSWIGVNDLSILKNEIFDENENLYFDDCMILDINHIKLFFNKTEPDKTYQKRSNNTQINLNQNDLNHIEVFQKMLNSNENFFGKFILFDIKNDSRNILDELRYTSIDNIKNQLKINSGFLKDIKISNSNLSKVKPLKNNIKGASKLINNNTLSIGTIFSDLENTNLRLISPTYTNLSEISLDPHYILKNFRWIKEFLDIETPTKAKNFLNKKRKTFRSNISNYQDESLSPLKYSSWSLKNMVNAYILIYFFRISNHSEILTKAYEFYRSKIIENKIDISNINSMEVTDITDYDKIYGTVIDHRILLNARSSNQLFIKNCSNSSQIDLYSEKLFDEDPNIYRKENIKNIINKELETYGLKFKDFNEMTNSLENIFKLDFSENFSQEEKNNSINGLKCFIIKHISLLNSFKVEDKIYYKISLPKDLVVERRKVLGRGSWNVASEGIVFKGNDKLKENSEVVLRTFWNDTNLYTIRNNFKQTKLSFFDNIIGIIITILQEKVFNLKITNNIYSISYDASVDLSGTPTQDYVNSQKEENFFINENVPLYMTSVNEKVTGTTLNYLKDKQYNFDIFLEIFSQIVLKLDFLQKKIKFIHGDLKLDNVFYNINNGKLEILLSDFGGSGLEIDEVRIYGNPSLSKKFGEKNPFYGRDILYFLINALYEVEVKIKRDDDQLNNAKKLEINILKLINYLIKEDVIEDDIEDEINEDEIDEDKINSYRNSVMEKIKDNNEFFFRFDNKKIYKFGKIFKIEHNYPELFAKKVKDKLEKHKDYSKFITNINSMNNSTYYKKYLKYKKKYLKLKN